MAHAFLIGGFGLAVTGVFLLAGPGWACLVSGLVLFAAGGLDARRPSR